MIDPNAMPQSFDPTQVGGRKLTKKEQKRAARELMQKKKELEREQKKAKAQLRAELKNSDPNYLAEIEKERKKRDSAKDVYNAIGFNLMYEDGTAEVEKGLFSQTLEFSDISYQSSRYEDQLVYFDQYAQIFDYCGADTSIEINVVNVPMPKELIGHQTFFPELADPELRPYVAEYNKVLNAKMKEGISNLSRARYLTYSIAAESYERALPMLTRVGGDIAESFRRMGCTNVRTLNGHERLELINSQMRPGTQYEFDYRSLYLSGLTAKDSVCPQTLDFKPGDANNSVFKTDGIWGQVLVFRSLGSSITDMAVSTLIDLPVPINVSLHMQALDKGKSLEFVKRRLAWIDKDIVEYQQQAVRKGFDYQLLPQELSYTKEDAEELLNEMLYKNQRLFIFTGLVYTYADSYEKLVEQSKQIIAAGRRNSIEIDLLDCQQRQALNSVLPLGSNHIEAKRFITTSQAAIMIPFATQELSQKGGAYYGQNKESSNLIMFDRSKLAAPMGFVLGTPGSGKSFAVKREITNSFLLHPDDEFIIIDPQGEYPPLVQRLGGNVVNISPGGGDHVNVFDIYSGAYDVTGEDPTLFKAQSILAITSVVLGRGNEGLSPEERTIIDRCVRLTYQEFENSALAPTLGDFYEILKQQPEPEAARLVVAWEMYIEGSLSYFNHRTTVDINSRITSFSFKQLGDTMKVFAMLVVLDFAYNRMLFNFERGVRTWLYIDEVQSLFSIKSVVAYFDKFWAEGRKFNLIPTGITQTVARVLADDTAKLLLRNSDFLMLLKQSDPDRKTLADLLGLSDQQEKYIDRTVNPGEGLLIAGSSFIPFKDNWPKGDLYDLWNTKPEEVAEKKRAAWQKAQDEKRAEAKREAAVAEQMAELGEQEKLICSVCQDRYSLDQGKVMPDGSFVCDACADALGW